MDLLNYIFSMFVILLGVSVGSQEAYKSSRPSKVYDFKPWHRPRWHPIPRPPKFHRPKKIPVHVRGHQRYAPFYEDPAVDNQPYAIEIQLPTHQAQNYRNRNYRKKNDREYNDEYINDEDYVDEYEDSESRVFHVGKKNLRIKVIKGINPKLQIKISRKDNENDIEIIDRSNGTTMLVPQKGNSILSSNRFYGGWIPNSPSYLPQDLAGV